MLINIFIAENQKTTPIRSDEKNKSSLDLCIECIGGSNSLLKKVSNKKHKSGIGKRFLETLLQMRKGSVVVGAQRLLQ